MRGSTGNEKKKNFTFFIYLKNNLAWYELHVARHYFGQGAYLAAANRGKYIVEHYQQTLAVPEALELMVNAYRAMNMNELADSALKVLEMNYSNHPSLAEVKSVKSKAVKN